MRMLHEENSAQSNELAFIENTMASHIFLLRRR